MISVGVDYERARLFGRVLGGLMARLRVDSFTDQRFYPPESADRETIAMYFLVMVAMDHRLSRPGRPYEGVVDGEVYHGADLLYRLGRKTLDEDPDFFTAERLSKISEADVRKWLSARDSRGRVVEPPDPALRAMLLRDLGIKLSSFFDGSAYRVVLASRGYLKRGAGGFINELKVFKAYQDPVEKKAYLLAKFLERRGVLHIADPHNKEVPVDNHLARIAVRLGIVRVDRDTLEAIALGRPFTWEEDVLLRMTARLAYKEAAREAGVDPFVIDDFLWMFGRKCCTREDPVCRSGCRRACEELGACSGGSCVFEEVCLARRDPIYMVPEHNYIDTWYY